MKGNFSEEFQVLMKNHGLEDYMLFVCREESWGDFNMWYIEHGDHGNIGLAMSKAIVTYPRLMAMLGAAFLTAQDMYLSGQKKNDH